MSGRGIRRKKSATADVKVAVIGAPGVGKSALIVRFLTKRYIGEYDHRIENRYKYETFIDGEPVLYDLLDTCPKTHDEYPNTMELLQWADGLLLVYSITDRNSFNYIRKALSNIQIDAMPLQLLANKVDMVHLRQVSRDEGEILAKDIECKFNEVSAADHIDQVIDVFHELYRDIIVSKRKSKQSLLERMLGTTRPYSRGKSDSNLSKDPFNNQ